MNDQERTELIAKVATAERVRRVKKCLDIVEGYGHFRNGQDGYQALIEVTRFIEELEGIRSPYGYCPHCSKRVVDRERKDRGNDTCENGHVYPSSASRGS